MVAHNKKQVLFSIGQVVATPDAIAVMAQVGVTPRELLRRHMTGDWGDLSREDCLANERAIKDGSRIFSSYIIHDDKGQEKAKLWVITEAKCDGWRQSTCILTPDEY